MAQWARLSAKHWRGARDDVMGYGAPFGLTALREAIAAHLRANRGIACEREQVFITGGAQHAFHLVGSVLLNPGDKVWFENPGAIGARNGLVACGAEDRVCPPELSLEIAHAIPGARLAIVERAGHYLTLDQPEITGRLLAEWLVAPAPPQSIASKEFS